MEKEKLITIKVSNETYSELVKLKEKGETFSDVIKKLIEVF